MVSEGRRRGGTIHDEMAQGRGGEELATARNRGRQERRQGETGGTVGRGAAVLMQLSMKAKTKMVDRVARYRFG